MAKIEKKWRMAMNPPPIVKIQIVKSELQLLHTVQKYICIQTDFDVNAYIIRHCLVYPLNELGANVVGTLLNSLYR